MKTSLMVLLGAVLLTACHHHDRRDNERRPTPAYQRDDRDRKHPRDRSRRNTAPAEPYRLHRPQGFLPPVGMRWDCPTEPQMLGYATR